MLHINDKSLQVNLNLSFRRLSQSYSIRLFKTWNLFGRRFLQILRLLFSRKFTLVFLPLKFWQNDRLSQLCHYKGCEVAGIICISSFELVLLFCWQNVGQQRTYYDHTGV